MTDSKRWARIEEVFQKAADLGGRARGVFLENACSGDADLRTRVEALLRAEETLGDFLEVSLVRMVPKPAPSQPEQIGPYRIVRPLGAGGMGDVFLCLEKGPDFQRYVAVKVVRDPGFAPRFAQERSILAQLTHPGIARFLGGGSTEDGRPYYVMERVEGERLDVYCDRGLLTVRERVELLRRVCLSVQHAHTNLVVHRDLKPSNILVTQDGTPKLLDFGIAKLLDPQDHDLTGTGQQLATPVYAAPEQLRGDVVNTAADVYALGVILYEALTGHRPYTAAEAATRALESDPHPPVLPSVVVGSLGTRLAALGEEETVTPEAVSGKRRTEPGSLRRILRGDLDNIVLRAMRSAPEERYVSAAALADDLERYSNGLPVSARGDSVGYRMSKFIARNRIATFAAIVMVATMAFATVSTLSQNRQIQQQADRLVTERDRALEVQGFLLESFGAAGGGGQVGDSLTVGQVLDNRGEQLEALYSEDPGTRAEMYHVLADAYERLGVLEKAQHWAEKAVSARRVGAFPTDPELARSLGLLGWILNERNELKEGEQLLRESLAAWRGIAIDSVGLSRALNDLSGVLTNLAQLEEAESVGREAIKIRRAIFPADHPSIAITANNLGNILGLQGRHDESLVLLQESVEVLEAAFGSDHRRTLNARRNVAVRYAFLGEWERSAEMGEALVEAYKVLGGPLDIGLAWAYQVYGSALGRTEPADADSAFALGYRIAVQRLGDHELTASFLFQRSALSQRRGDRAAALDHMREAVALYRRMYTDHPQLAEALRRQGAVASLRAEQLSSYREAAGMLTRLEGETGPGAVRLTLSWARSLMAAGQAREGLGLFRLLERTVPVAYGENHGYSPAPFLGQAQAHALLGEMREARVALNEARSRMTGAGDVAPNQRWLTQVEEMIS